MTPQTLLIQAFFFFFSLGLTQELLQNPVSDVNNVELKHTLNKPIHAESDHLHSSLRFPIALSGGEE